MELVLAKPSMAAFEGDVSSSIKTLNEIREQFGMPKGAYQINNNLAIDFGLQLIIRDKDLDSLGEIEEKIKRSTDGVPLSIHAPYNYGEPEDWVKTDLTRDVQGLENLMKVADFSNNIGAMSIAVHPNAIRKKEHLEDKAKYNPQVQRELLELMSDRVLEANSYCNGIIDLENKPLPATTPDNESPIFTTVFHPMSHLKYFTERGGTITFDTCHYGITRATINEALKRFGENLTDEDLRREEMFGYFAEDYVLQPTIAEAMVELGPAINHIHLNDGSVYRPNKETGLPNKSDRLPMVGGYQLWYEAYVPGKGELCDTDCVVPWIEKHQKDDRAVTLTLEVTEFNNDYENNPRAREAFKDTLKSIYDNFKS